MIKEIKTTKTVEVTDTKYECHCDICNAELNLSIVTISSIHKCFGCGKDICEECIGYTDTSFDNPDYYCKFCHSIYKKYKNFENILYDLQEMEYKEQLDGLQTSLLNRLLCDIESIHKNAKK